MSVHEKILRVDKEKAKYRYLTFKLIYSNFTLIFSDFDIYENCATIDTTEGKNKDWGKERYLHTPSFHPKRYIDNQSSIWYNIVKLKAILKLGNDF